MKKLFYSILAFIFIITPNIAIAQNTNFTLEDYFIGKTSAKGEFSAINGIKRKFDVILFGSFENNILTLREDFYFEDGTKDVKTWRFEKIKNGEYLGTREDVIGKTKVIIKGNVASFTYLVYLDGANKKQKVRFHDKMMLINPNELINQAKVTKFFIPIAKTRVTFIK